MTYILLAAALVILGGAVCALVLLARATASRSESQPEPLPTVQKVQTTDEGTSQDRSAVRTKYRREVQKGLTQTHDAEVPRKSAPAPRPSQFSPLRPHTRGR